jgi:tetratricopeptide (TPR) repeat protein
MPTKHGKSKSKGKKRERATDPASAVRAATDRSAGRRARDLLPWILAIAALALVVRFLYILELRGHPLMLAATGDPKVYDLRALEIAGGKWLGDEVFFHSSPLYPYFLGIVYAIVGHSYTAVRVLQSVIGTGSCLLVFSITRTLAGRRQAVVAGLIAALYVPFIFFDSELLMITLVIFFALLSLRLLLTWERDRTPWLLPLAGLALGVAALGKPNALLFVPAAALWIWWVLRAGGGGAPEREGDRPRSSPSSRPARALAPIALLVAGVVLALVPFTVSNYVIADDFVLTSSNGGVNFWIGNNEEAKGTFLVEQSMRTDLYEGSKELAEQRLGRELTPSQVSDYWFGEGLRFVRESPGRALGLVGKKFLLFWNGYEIPNHYNLYYFRQVSRLLRFDPVLFLWVVPFGILGVYLSARSWRRYLLLYLFAGTYLVSLLPFFITSRYRLPVVPVMIVFAGVALVRLWEKIKSKEAKGWIAPAAVLVAAFVFVNLPLVSFTFTEQYALLGAVHRDAGDYEEAAEQFRLAIRENPEFDLAWSNLGAVLGRLGRYPEAEEALVRAVELNPQLAAAYNNLGNIYFSTGQVERAKARFIEAASIDPDHKPAWENLARVGLVSQDGELAVRALRRMIEIDPEDAYAYWNLAVLYSQDPAAREASIELATRAAALDPEFAQDARSLIARLSTDPESGGAP